MNEAFIQLTSYYGQPMWIRGSAINLITAEDGVAEVHIEGANAVALVKNTAQEIFDKLNAL